jgi:drug/metabolite transporter (DMT)-like permease
VSVAEVVLLTANAVYGTSYVTMRPALEAAGPIALAFLRLTIGLAMIAPVGFRARGAGAAPLSPADHRTLFWMGFVGFTLAMALAHWGLAWSTATNAALLVATEPIALVALAPLVLGETLTRREGWGTLLALVGAPVIVVNGVPGLTVAIAPHWRGDLLLLLSGVCFAAYSLFGRPILARRPSIQVTPGPSSGASSRRRRSPPSSGGSAIAPLDDRECGRGALSGSRDDRLGYLVWNWALERVSAARAAIYLNVQPLVGTLLGVVWLGEPFSPYTAVGGGLVIAGLSLALTGRPHRADGVSPGSEPATRFREHCLEHRPGELAGLRVLAARMVGP